MHLCPLKKMLWFVFKIWKKYDACIKYPSIHMHLNPFYLFKDIVVNYVLVYPRASFIVKWQFLSTSSWCSLHIISIIYSWSEADDGFLCPQLGLWFVHRNHQRPWRFQGCWKASLRQRDGQIWSRPAGRCGMGLLVEEGHHTTCDPTAPSTLVLCSNQREILTEIYQKKIHIQAKQCGCFMVWQQIRPGFPRAERLSGNGTMTTATHCDLPALPRHSHWTSWLEMRPLQWRKDNMSLNYVLLCDGFVVWFFVFFLIQLFINVIDLCFSCLFQHPTEECVKSSNFPWGEECLVISVKSYVSTVVNKFL